MQRTQKSLIFLTALTTLTLAFYANTFKVADSGWFEHFADGSEAYLIARLAKSRQDGIFSAGALAGREVERPEGTEEFAYQHEIYYNAIPIQDYKPYKSTPAIQGTLFSILDRCLGLD